MPVEFEKKVADFIKDGGFFEAGGKVLLAVSGGADSMGLLYAMCALKMDGVLSVEIVCAHVNHQLRGSESDRDEDFVVAQAGNLGLPITTRRLDVRGFAYKNKLSIETAARKLRMESLLDIAEANDCNCIATGHQKDDNAETVLQRLARGTGFRGLGGIWPVRVFSGGVRFVRPLLCVRRDEIIGYLQQKGLSWRVDHTNEDCTYRRNYIRHWLIPTLQRDCVGAIVEQLFELSQSAQGFYNLVCSVADKVWGELADCGGGKVVLVLERFANQAEPVKVELIRRGLTTIGSGERDLAQGHYERILQLAGRETSGKRIELPGGFVVWREYGKLVFEQLTVDRGQKTEESKELEVPGQTKFDNYLIEAKILDVEGRAVKRDSCLRRNDIVGKSGYVEWFDLGKVKLPLVVRSRRAGDRFWPLGLAGEKKVGKFLTAAKVSQELRRKLLIVADSEKIIWVWPIRMSERVKITGETRQILQLQIVDSR